jgi:hypothetical protein
MKHPWLSDFYIRHAAFLLQSFHRWTGEHLLPGEGTDREMAQALFEAPFVVVSHDAAKDPVLNYGNHAALDLWEMTWDSFVHTPSRLTAENIERVERAHFLREVTDKGISKNYRGIRISSSGRRFRIEGATLWNILDEADRYYGQAAVFNRWTFL